MIVAIASVLLLLQSKPLPDKDMPLTILPVSAPKFLIGKPIISISDYFVTATRITRVFRYSYQADFSAVIEQCKKELKGWKMTVKPGGSEVDFDFTGNGKQVRYQAVILNNTRLVRDEHMRAKSRPQWKEKTKGWIWVSYDEGYQSGMAPKD
jgi:hypothetical protein